jgi:hypothetical protein
LLRFLLPIPNSKFGCYNCTKGNLVFCESKGEYTSMYSTNVLFGWGGLALCGVKVKQLLLVGQEPSLSSLSSVNKTSLINVSLINGAPLAAHNREHGWYIRFITLNIGCALYSRVVIPSLVWACKTLIHSRGEWPRIHYEAFTKIPWGCSCPLGFLNIPHSSPRGNPPLAERAAYTEPHWRHDSEANYTPVPLII